MGQETKFGPASPNPLLFHKHAHSHTHTPCRNDRRMIPTFTKQNGVQELDTTQKTVPGITLTTGLDLRVSNFAPPLPPPVVAPGLNLVHGVSRPVASSRYHTGKQRLVESSLLSPSTLVIFSAAFFFLLCFLLCFLLILFLHR